MFAMPCCDGNRSFAKTGSGQPKNHQEKLNQNDLCVCCFAAPANAWQKTVANIKDPKNESFADIRYWVVEGDVGPVATFNKIGGAGIQAYRIGALPPTCEEQ